METKKCAKCQEEKTLDNFCKDKQKKDGLRNYCRECEKEIKAKSKTKKEMGIIEEKTGEIMTPIEDNNIFTHLEKNEMVKKDTEKEIEKYNTTVEYLAKLVAKQYGQDLIRADEVYDLFYNKISRGDNSQASKEALTKSLELRISASNSILKLIDAASKIQKEHEKNKGNKMYNMGKIKDNFDL